MKFKVYKQKKILSLVKPLSVLTLLSNTIKLLLLTTTAFK